MGKEKNDLTDFFYHPNIIDLSLDDLFMVADNNYNHIQALASLIFQGISLTSILEVDIVKYMGETFE